MAALLLAMLLAVPAAQLRTTPGTISGRVLTKDGAPAVGVRIGALAVNDIPGQQALMSIAQTDRAGRYHLEDVPPGRYRIIAGALDSPSYFPGVSAENEATVVTLAAGARLEKIDFRLTFIPPLRISGRVLFDDGLQQPVGARIDISLIGGSLNGTTLIGPDGSFEFSNLRPGSYRAQLAPIRVIDDGMTREQVIIVEDRDITDIEFHIRPTVMLRQTIAIEGGPLPVFRLTLTDLTAKNAAPVNRAGTPDLTEFLFTGRYQVRVDGLPPGYVVQSMTSEGADLLKGPFEIRNTGEMVEMTIVLGVAPKAPWSTIAGHVTGPGASSIRRLKATSPLLQRSVSAEVGNDGAFQFSRLPAGTYTIEPDPGTEPLPTAVTVHLDRDQTGVEILTRGVRKISGRAIFEGDSVIPLNISFALDCPPAERLAGVSAKTRVDLRPDGSFTAILPVDGCHVVIDPDSISLGYKVTSFRIGTRELNTPEQPLFVVTDSAEELHITMSGPAIREVPVSGRVEPADPEIDRILFMEKTNPSAVRASNTGQTAVSADGAFTAGLPAGAYAVSIDPRSPVPFPGVSLNIAEGDPIDFVFSHPAFRKIIIHATIEGGGHLERMTFRVDGKFDGPTIIRGTTETKSTATFEFYGSSEEATLNADGVFQTRLPAGQYRVGATVPDGAPLRVKSITSGGVDLMTTPLDVRDKDVKIEIVFETLSKNGP